LDNDDEEADTEVVYAKYVIGADGKVGVYFSDCVA
jgi:hypothetical protein